MSLGSSCSIESTGLVNNHVSTLGVANLGSELSLFSSARLGSVLSATAESRFGKSVSTQENSFVTAHLTVVGSQKLLEQLVLASDALMRGS